MEFLINNVLDLMLLLFSAKLCLNGSKVAQQGVKGYTAVDCPFSIYYAYSDSTHQTVSNNV